jgi:hypothetical protein
MSRLTAALSIVIALASLLGLAYAGISTRDFSLHLDRELHPLSCSFIPGGGEPEAMGDAVEGCKAALFSEYSSFWRADVWGGVPVSTFALGLYAFTLGLAVWSVLTRRASEAVVGLFFALSGTIAAVASGIYARIALGELDVVCKTCAGMYAASALLFLAGVGVYFSGRADRRRSDHDREDPHSQGSSVAAPMSAWMLAIVLLAELGAASLVPPLVYATSVPDYRPWVTGCGSLADRTDPKGVLLSFPASQATPAQGLHDILLVVDPLCPACREFHRLVEKIPEIAARPKRVLLMPLDPECNWTVAEALHPGACMVSRAMLCAKDRAPALLDAVYAEQETLLALGKSGKTAEIRARLLGFLPDLGPCLDAPETGILLNEALQVAVRNTLPITTPQLYVDGRRLCQADTDLGLEFALGALLGGSSP